MKYRKKPIIVDAFKWNGKHEVKEYPEWIIDAMNPLSVDRGSIWVTPAGLGTLKLQIRTLEGVMDARKGDYIIRGIKGEIYPCKPDIFEATYEKVEG